MQIKDIYGYLSLAQNLENSSETDNLLQKDQRLIKFSAIIEMSIADPTKQFLLVNKYIFCFWFNEEPNFFRMPQAFKGNSIVFNS